LNFITSTVNTNGLINTPVNPAATGNERFEITGTTNPFGGGTGIQSPTAHSFLVTEGASNMNLVTSPTLNGIYYCGFNVTASAAVDPTCGLQGVPINAQSGTTYTIGAANTWNDRTTLIEGSNISAQTYTAVNPSTSGFGSNMVYVIWNRNT